MNIICGEKECHQIVKTTVLEHFEAEHPRIFKSYNQSDSYKASLRVMRENQKKT